MNAKFLAAALCLCIVPVFGADLKVDPSKADPAVTLEKVSDRLWMHTASYRFDFGACPAHGIVAVGEKGIVLVDTQWTVSQTETLLDQIEKKFGGKIVLAVITHAHADKIGGIDALRRRGIRVISTRAIADSAGKNGYPRPEAAVTENPQQFEAGAVRFETFFPGAAHTKDNITVWFPDEKLLFAGCIIKGAKDTTLGNTADGDVASYPAAVSALIARYPDAKTVVTTHSDPGGIDLLRHTLDIATNARK